MSIKNTKPVTKKMNTTPLSHPSVLPTNASADLDSLKGQCCYQHDFLLLSLKLSVRTTWPMHTVQHSCWALHSGAHSLYPQKLAQEGNKGKDKGIKV